MRYSIYNHVSDGILIVEDGLIQFINDKSCKLLGISGRDVLGERFDVVFQGTALLHLNDFQEKREVRGDKVFTIKKVPQNPSDKYNFIIICQDITLLEEIGQHVYEHSADLNGWILKIFESVTDGLSVMDSHGVLVRINSACENIFGVNRSEVVNKHVIVLKRERIINKSVTMKVLSRREPASVNHITRVKNQVLSTGVPIFDKQGNIAFVAVICRDMAKLKAQEIICMSTKCPKRHSHKNLIEETEITKKLNKRGFVLQSQKILKILPVISKVTKSESTVLLHGETGVGKEAIAKLIHDLGPRGHKPFIHVNCRAIPREVIESELFGYEPGVFTGARKEGEKGLIEAADMGTLYLDEISELDQSLQSKLLLMLQEDAIKRVGGAGPIRVNVRIVAASSRNLKEMVEKREFRADLFYRISVVPLHIPPLRERQEAIPELLRQYLKKFNEQYKKNVSFTKRAVSLLSLHNWPGNIDQLVNAVESCVVLAKKTVVKPEDLNIDISFTREQDMKTLDEIISKTERDHLLKAVCLYGSTYKIAEALGISQPTVTRKIKKHLSKEFALKRVEY